MAYGPSAVDRHQPAPGPHGRHQRPVSSAWSPPAATNPGAELVTWWGERYCKTNLGEVVRPDGVGVWREGDATVTFCLEYDRGTEPLGRISAKAHDYERLERAWGIAFWLPGRRRRERGVRAALAGQGLAVATATRSGVQAPETAVWAPLGVEGTRLRLAELAGWSRRAASIARVAEAIRLRAGEPAFEGR